jgi:iron(III) transport system substrate-binding protein
MGSRWVLAALLFAGCRIETAAPGGRVATASGAPAGEVWVYTSVYRHVLDAFEPVLRDALPGVTVRWFQAGSEKIGAKLEAEFAAGGTPCDVLMTSDPFLYQRFKKEARWLRYASPDGQRTPRSLVDPDGHFAAVRLSTMVLVHRVGTPAPTSFESLTQPAWKGEVALGDPLTSGTAFTWAVLMERALGPQYFEALRDNGARVAGGNAAVLQKVEGGEASVGVVLLENALAAKAKGSQLEVAWPKEGAVLVPGYAGILASTRNAQAAKAFVDVVLSPRGQALMVDPGDMHGVDPRLPGPRHSIRLEELLQRTQPFDEGLLERGLLDGARVKAAFVKAFAK